jgi:hypothetical protein
MRKREEQVQPRSAKPDNEIAGKEPAMQQPGASRQQIVLELTEEQSRQIERATGKLVTELQIEIVEAPESPEAARQRQLEQATNHESSP